MKNTRFLPAVLVTMMLILACGISISGSQVVHGSGKITSQTRTVPEFTSIELAGSGDVTVRVGGSQSVVIETDDNIQPLIETTVRGGKLVVGTKPNTSISTKQPVHVTITVKSLDSASLTGSGNITISDMNADAASINLQGSGNITTSGKAQNVQATLTGSGNIVCADLQASSATVRISGSGNISVNASQSLDASISGSGTIKYRGNPTRVNQSVTGSGSINPIP